MSHHDDHDHCERGHSHEPGPEGGPGPDTSFLDFELHKLMYDDAESIVREAYRELLKQAVKERLQDAWGERITALANLAADEAMADADANFQIQALIEARNDARRGLEDRVQAIIRSEEPGEAPRPEAGDEDE